MFPNVVNIFAGVHIISLQNTRTSFAKMLLSFFVNTIPLMYIYSSESRSIYIYFSSSNTNFCISKGIQQPVGSGRCVKIYYNVSKSKRRNDKQDSILKKEK